MLRGGRWGKPLGAIGVLMDLSFAGELSGPFAAADGDGSTHDVRRLVGCNKHDGLGDLFGSPHAFERHSRDPAVQERVWDSTLVRYLFASHR